MLALALAALRPALKIDYTLLAVHISTDFCSCCKKTTLAARLTEWDIPFDDVFVPVLGRLKEGRKMNCWWCSTQRRTELLRYAQTKNCGKIALGHHLDDIIETFFMNLTQSGKMLAMPAKLAYKKYPVELIRPLLYVEEEQVRAACAEKGLLAAVCTCPFGVNSERKKVKNRLETFLGEDTSSKKRLVLRALLDAGLV
jgi:tRNA 2-thiocytidine biosynthesis protein TtcA